MARGRPVSTTPVVECHIHLRLRQGEDDDLIQFLAALPNGRRAQALKAALRSGGMQTGPLVVDTVDDELLASIDDFLK